MSDGTETGEALMSESTAETTESTAATEDGGTSEAETLDQAAVDKIAAKIRSEERRKAAEKYADYDDLKAKADGAKTLEDRVAGLEQKSLDAEARAIRAEVANAKGLTPTQAKRLVGATREELESDADELLKDIGAKRSKSAHVPSEGANPRSAPSDEKAAVKALFGGS